MFVEKLGGGTFSISEIKRLFGELSEDMEEDFAEIWLEIQNQGKRLRFLETNILSPSYPRIITAYCILLKKKQLSCLLILILKNRLTLKQSNCFWIMHKKGP